MLFLNFPSLKENRFSYGTAAEREKEGEGGGCSVWREVDLLTKGQQTTGEGTSSASLKTLSLCRIKAKFVFFPLNAPREGFWEGESKHGSGRGQELKTGFGFKREDEEEAVDRVSSHLIRRIYGKFNKERQRVKVYSLFVLC